MKKAEGSYTVEAALVVPIILFTLMFVLQQGIELYTQAVNTMQREEWWGSFDPVQEFEKNNHGGEGEWR